MIHRQQELWLWRTIRLLGDLAAGLLAMVVSFLVRIHVAVPLTLSRLPAERIQHLAVASLLVLATQNLMLYFFGLYDPPRPRSTLGTLRPLCAATFVQGLALMGYFFLAERAFPRSIVVLFIVANALVLFAWRLLLQRLLRTRERRVVLVGANPEAQELARKINKEHWMGLRIMGFVPAPHQENDAPSAAEREGLGPRLGCINDLPRLLEEGVVDDIILADDADRWQTLLVDRLARVSKHRGSVLVLPNPYESLIGRMRFRSIQDAPLIEVVRESEWKMNRPLKRFVDILLASVLFVLALPLIGLCALAIRMTSPGPALYRQDRIGQDRLPFVLWKLRTMCLDAEDENEEVLAQLDDPRLIPIGGLLRRLRLDELPQLWNVLNGTMSLVGPRPERPGFVRRYLDEIPGYAERFTVPPGLTGLAQINGHYHSTPQTKLRYDLAYVANWSMWLDVTLLLRTVRIVLTSQGT